MRLVSARPRIDLSDMRPLQLAVGMALLIALGLFLSIAIGRGDYSLAGRLGGLALAPVFVAIGLRRPYVFPYCLYVILVPFDNLLRLGGAGTATKLLGIVAAGFVVVHALRERRIGHPPVAVYFALAYMVWLVLSVLWSADMALAATDAQSMVSLILLYVIFALAPIGERDLRLICACIIFGGVISSFYGMYLLHGGATGEDYGRLMIDVDNRTIDPNHFANALLAPLALALVGLMHARKIAPLLVYGSSVLVIGAGQLISLSREALLGSLLVVVVLIAFSKRRLLGAAIALPVIGLLPIVVPAIGQRMLELGATGGAGRTFVWQIVWRSVQQHPLIGWGAGGSIVAYDRNYLSVYALIHQNWGRPPHNTPLHILVELGVVGLLLAGLAFVTAFRQFAGITRNDGLFDLRVALTAALIALGFVSLFIDMQNYKYLWLVLIAIAQLRTVARTRVPGRPPEPALPRAPARTSRGAVAAG